MSRWVQIRIPVISYMLPRCLWCLTGSPRTTSPALHHPESDCPVRTSEMLLRILSVSQSAGVTPTVETLGSVNPSSYQEEFQWDTKTAVIVPVKLRVRNSKFISKNKNQPRKRWIRTVGLIWSGWNTEHAEYRSHSLSLAAIILWKLNFKQVFARL